jgi:hypothetical protein
MSQQKVTERLLAHARLCRQLAAASWNEEIAGELEQLASDCKRAAAISESFTPQSAIIPNADAEGRVTRCAN